MSTHTPSMENLGYVEALDGILASTTMSVSSILPGITMTKVKRANHLQLVDLLWTMALRKL